MIATTAKVRPSLAEFVVLVSLMMSLTALSIDAMLPALPQIAADLGVANANDRQLVISTIFLGLAGGQLFFGPLSDRTGRKPAMFAGYAAFIAGSVIALLAFSFPMLLLGRLLQGAGVSAPRAVTLALVRDRYEGRAMAQVMSLVMTVFILVPMIAPIVGQTILLFSGWRAIFAGFILLAAVTLIWFGTRMPETLAEGNRAAFSLRRIVAATGEIVRTRPSLAYTVTAGLISGAHLGYLNSAQQIFQEQYELGELFPLYFGFIASALGVASLLNSRLVLRLGMRLMVRLAMLSIVGLSVAALVVALLTAGQPPLALFMAYLMVTFFFVGIMFGNMNSLAMEPLGHIAGIGAAIIGSLSTLISVVLGTLIGRSYNGTILPLIAGVAILTGAGLFIVRWGEAGRQ